MSDPYTDDQIAELFRSANPIRVATPRAVLADPDGAPRSGPMTEASMPAASGRRPERWWLVTLVAASVALVVSLVVVASRDTAAPAPAEQPAPTAPAGPSDDVAIVASFVDALNAHDSSSVTAVLTPDATIRALRDSEITVAEVPGLMDWYEAFGWQWDPATCDVAGADGIVECDVEERNRLTELTGAERPARVTFGLRDGAVDDVVVVADTRSYAADFLRFRGWVTENHPSDVDRLWTTAGGPPILSADSASLLDERLSEYSEQYVDPPSSD